MNKTLSASLIVIAVIVLAGSIFFFGAMYGRANFYGPLGVLLPNRNASPFGWNNSTNGPSMTLAPGASAGVGGWNYQYQTPTDVSAEMTVSAKQAVQNAQQYLDTNYAGATAANDPTQFYGYYTLDFEKDSKVIGMLSVNGYSGQVFLHTWHGTFIEEAE